MSQNVRQSNLFSAEDFTKLYKSFKNVNFMAYDVDSIQNALIESLRINYPENFNDYIQSSEFIAQIQLLSYIASSIAFRSDLNSRENILDTAERRESIIRLARMVNYQPSRNIPLSGIFKLKAIETNEPITDNIGRGLQNQTVYWNDPNNPDSYDQFITIIDSAFSTTNPFGKPYKKQIINNIPTSLYQINSLKDYEVAYPISINIQGRSVPFDVCNVDLDDDGVMFEKHPNPQNAFTIMHRNDGQGLDSLNTGFFLYFKQGKLIKKDYDLQLPIKNRVIEVEVDNVNETDVFVQEINTAGDVLEEWTKVQSVNGGTNVIYNAINLNNRNIFGVISDTNDRVKVNFTDGNFGKVPTGIFRIWVRPSLNKNVSLRPETAKNLSISIPYVNKEGTQHVLKLTFDLEYAVSNGATTETLTQVKNRAPQVYYTQNRMVNNEDYNVFPLTRGNEIIKVRTINRTHAGHSRYIGVNDPTGFHQNILLTADDGAIYKDITSPSIKVGIDEERDEEVKIVTTDLTYFIRNQQLVNFFYDELLVEYKIHKEKTYDSTSTYNRYNVYEFMGIYTYLPVPENEYDNKGVLVRPDSTYFNFEEPLTNEMSFGMFAFIRTGAKVKFIDPLNIQNEIYVTVKSMDQLEGDVEGTLLIFDRYVPKGWQIKEIFPAYKTTFSQSEIDKLSKRVKFRNNFGLAYNIELYSWTIVDAYDVESEYEWNRYAKNWLVVANYYEDPVTKTKEYDLLSRGVEYIFESYKDVKFFFDDEQYDYDSITGQSKRDVIEVTTQNQIPEIVERWKNDGDGYWVNVEDANNKYLTSMKAIPLSNRQMIAADVVVNHQIDDIKVTVNGCSSDGLIMTSNIDFEVAGVKKGYLANVVADINNVPTTVTIRVEDINEDQITMSSSLSCQSQTVIFYTDLAPITHRVVNGMVVLDGKNPIAGDVIKISYLGKTPFMPYPIKWNIYGNVYQEDGYRDSSKTIIIPADSDTDGVPDLMFSYQKVVSDGSRVFMEKYKTMDGYESVRMWISKWIDKRDSTDYDFTYGDLVETHLFLTIPQYLSGLQQYISMVIIDEILKDTLTIDQINELNTVDTTVIYIERFQPNGRQISTVNTLSAPIMKRIDVDMDRVSKVLTEKFLNPSLSAAMVYSDVTLNPVSFSLDDNHYVKNGRAFDVNTQSEELKRKLNYKWVHFAPVDNRIDPSISNIMDMVILTATYYKDMLIWKNKRQSVSQMPKYPSSEELRLQFNELNSYKMQSDQIVFQPAKFKLLFGKQADSKLRANFKVVKMFNSTLTDNEIKTKVIEAIDIFFNVQNWDFGEAFYYTELAAFIHRYLAKFIASVVIVPTDKEAKFGNLFQIKAEPNELFLSLATVDNVEIISNLTETNLRV